MNSIERLLHRCFIPLCFNSMNCLMRQFINMPSPLPQGDTPATGRGVTFLKFAARELVTAARTIEPERRPALLPKLCLFVIQIPGDVLVVIRQIPHTDVLIAPAG